MSWFSTRPPTRSRASTTTTEAPRALSSRAAARPASPAPDHHHVGLVCRRVGPPPDPTSLPCPVRMPPATRSAEREEERRLNTRTLTIASVASASAAAVTSQLWIAGTWIAAAMTPVLVTLLSEALHRPTERIARAWTSDQPALRRRAASPREAVAPPHGDPLPFEPVASGPAVRCACTGSPLPAPRGGGSPSALWPRPRRSPSSSVVVIADGGRPRVGRVDRQGRLSDNAPWRSWKEAATGAERERHAAAD